MLAEFMVGFSVIMVLKGAVVRVIFVLGISCQCVLTDFENTGCILDSSRLNLVTFFLELTQVLERWLCC